MIEIVSAVDLGRGRIIEVWGLVVSTFMWPPKLFNSVPPGFARNIFLKKMLGGGEKKRKAGFRYGLDQALLSLSLIEATNLIYFHHQHRSPV